MNETSVAVPPETEVKTGAVACPGMSTRPPDPLVHAAMAVLVILLLVQGLAVGHTSAALYDGATRVQALP